MPRIGILSPSDSEQAPTFAAFKEGLRDLGYVEGRNIVLEFRLARGDYSLIARLAAELVALPVDVIVTDGGPAPAQIAMKATTQIPIVMGTSGIDPVLSGLVPSLSHPGGNVTGFTLMHSDLDAKRLEVLRTSFPGISTVAILFNPSNPALAAYIGPVEQSGRSMGVSITSRIEAANVDSLRALQPSVFSGADAVMVVPDAMFWNRHREIVELINKTRLPAIYPEREYADDGGLLAYGANVPDNFRRAAGYVDRILKGANPGDLPIQEPVKFDFVVNLRTAKMLGLTIPREILIRADEVIE